jgi:hypothetical protein
VVLPAEEMQRVERELAELKTTRRGWTGAALPGLTASD